MRISIFHLTFIPGPNVKRDFVMSAGTRTAVMAAQFRDGKPDMLLLYRVQACWVFFSPPLSFTTYGSRDSASCVFRTIGRMLSQPVHPPPLSISSQNPYCVMLINKWKKKEGGVLEQIRRQVAFITNVGNTQENHKRRTWAIEFPDRENSKKQPKQCGIILTTREFLPQ